MSPAEKAKWLVERFHKEMYLDLGGGVVAYINKAKECALICVDEVLAETDKWGGYNVECSDDDGIACSPSVRTQYWLSVKEQINIL